MITEFKVGQRVVYVGEQLPTLSGFFTRGQIYQVFTTFVGTDAIRVLSDGGFLVDGCPADFILAPDTLFNIEPTKQGEHLMKDLPKDLEFLAKTVRKWPHHSLKNVRLDGNGEICFTDERGCGTAAYDFYPYDQIAANQNFLSEVGMPTSSIGTQYPRKDWEEAVRSLAEEALAPTPTQPLADPLAGLLAAIKEPLEGVLDHVVVYALQEQLKAVEEQPLSSHPDDIEYNKKLAKALKRVLHYYGIQG